MTLPDERWAAVDRTRDFLRRLLRETPRIPRVVREEAASLLRHYPGEYATKQALQRELDETQW